MQLRPLLTTATLTTAALICLSGCGSSSDSSASANTTTKTSTPMSSKMSMSSGMPMSGGHKTHPAASAAVITIKDYGYTGPASVSPGATVTVKNDDTVNHTVTADTGSAFDVTVDASATASFTAPSKPGSYPYHCTYHSNMHATLVVK